MMLNRVVLIYQWILLFLIIVPSLHTSAVSNPIKISKENYKQLAQLFILVNNEPDVYQGNLQKDATQAEKAITNLGILQESKAARILVKKIELHTSRMFTTDSIATISETFPAIAALIQVGSSAIPDIVDSMSGKDIIKGTLFSFDTNAIYAIRHIIDARTNKPITALFSQYANEYEQQAMRLRLLTEHLADAPLVKSMKVKPLVTQEEQITRLARIFELEDLIRNEKLTAKDEAKVVAAIEELSALGAVETASTLADKLSWEIPTPSAPPEKPRVADPYAGDTFDPMPTAPEVMSADPKGLLSPKITEAAKKALQEIGAPALPAIIEAVSQRYRLPRFRENAMTLVVQLSGGKAEGSAALNKAAEDNDKKVKRLRELAASLLPAN